MNKIKFTELEEYKDFYVVKDKEISIAFSTAKNDRSFNRSTDTGVEALNSLKDEFDVKNISYLKQIHSDTVFCYNNEKDFIENEGDAIITDKVDSIIGVFTADCVPIILYDNNKNVIAAIHSGWRGTFKSITKKVIEKMVKDYGASVDNIKVYIGPHIRGCCYEVSEELKEQFLKEKNIKEDRLFKGRNLNLLECILEDLRVVKIKEENINLVDSCTYCEENVKLHSYRKSEGDYGRLFSFIYVQGEGEK